MFTSTLARSQVEGVLRRSLLKTVRSPLASGWCVIVFFQMSISNYFRWIKIQIKSIRYCTDSRRSTVLSEFSKFSCWLQTSQRSRTTRYWWQEGWLSLLSWNRPTASPNDSNTSPAKFKGERSDFYGFWVRGRWHLDLKIWASKSSWLKLKVSLQFFEKFLKFSLYKRQFESQKRGNLQTRTIIKG